MDTNASNPEATKETIRYYYADGKVQSLVYKKGNAAETTYFLTYNGQGDVVAIYRSSDSTLIGTYEYDLWGKPVSVKEVTKGIDKDDILNKNPIRYRGYHYDQETGFYYLKARYYDAEVRRFISADELIAQPGTSVHGYNLYAYCQGNPIILCDKSGQSGTLTPIYKDLQIMIQTLAGLGVTLTYLGECALIVLAVAVTGAEVYLFCRNIAKSVEDVKAVAKYIVDTVEATEAISYEDCWENSVYIMKNIDTHKVEYVGRTNAPKRRADEHRRDKRKGHLSPPEVVLTGLSKDSARVMEQAIISAYFVKYSEENAVKLINQRRGISVKTLSKNEVIRSECEMAAKLQYSYWESEFLCLLEEGL